MKRIMLSFAVLSLLISNYACATTYTFIGENFGRVHGVYTKEMKVTGSFTTSNPIPPNSVNFDVRPILTGWSFNDGVNTIGSPDSKFEGRVVPTFSTDAEGNISRSVWAITSTPIPTTIGGTYNVIEVFSVYDEPYTFVGQGYTDKYCSEVTDGVCTIWTVGESYAGGGEGGVWEVFEEPLPVATPIAIPALSKWSLMTLYFSLALVGVSRTRWHT